VSRTDNTTTTSKAIGIYFNYVFRTPRVLVVNLAKLRVGSYTWVKDSYTRRKE